MSVSVKVWVLALGMVIVGVIIGGLAVWFRQSRWRRSARGLDRELRALRSENQDLKQRIETADIMAAPASARRIALRPPAA